MRHSFSDTQIMENKKTLNEFEKWELQDLYRSNEAVNDHVGNMVMLAEKFGTEDEERFAREVMAKRDRGNGLDSETWSQLYHATKKYQDELFGD